MKIIDLYNETTKVSCRRAVTENTYKMIKALQYLGGFKRFGLEIYDEGVHIVEKEYDLEWVKVFLNDIFYLNVLCCLEYEGIKREFGIS